MLMMLYVNSILFIQDSVPSFFIYNNHLDFTYKKNWDVQLILKHKKKKVERSTLNCLKCIMTCLYNY